MKTNKCDLFTNVVTSLLIAISLAAMLTSTSIAAEETEPAIRLKPEFQMNRIQLDIWQDPQFQKQFTQSYIAETEIEPSITLDEREDMLKILENISSDKPDGLDKAVKQIIKILDKNEGASAVFDFTLANIYFQQADAEDVTEEVKNQRLQQAVTYYSNAVEKWPKFRRAWANMALIQVREQDFEEAIPMLTKVIELGGYDARTFGFLGYAYSRTGNSISAESAYRMAILLDPVTLDWKIGLAQSFFLQERFAEVAAISKQLIKEHPDKPNLWLLQANAYIGLNQPLKAAEIYELLNHLGQGTDKTLNMLGDIYINNELYELAVNYYVQAMEKAPEGKPDRAIRAAKVLSARAALEETKQLIGQIEQIHANDLNDEHRKELLKLRSRIAVAEGAGEEEFKVLEEIVALDPLDGEALILLGLYHERKEEFEMAINRYEQAESIDEHEENAKLSHAQLLVKLGKYKEALPLLKRVIQIRLNDNRDTESIQKYHDSVERLSK